MDDGLLPYELEQPRGDVGDNIPSWPNVIDDAASRGKYYLRVGGGAYAYAAVGAELKRMISQKTWRSPEAAKVLLRIERAMMAEVRICEAQSLSTPA